MSLETKWEWGPISQGKDISVVSTKDPDYPFLATTSEYQTKNNWSLTRSRVMKADAKPESELGTWAKGVTAFNGGTPKTIYQPFRTTTAFNFGAFSGTPTWTTTNQYFEPLIGAESWGQPVYQIAEFPFYSNSYNEVNMPDADSFTYVMVIRNAAGTLDRWAVVQLENRFSFSLGHDSLTDADITNWIGAATFTAGGTPQALLTLAFTTVNGTFTGTATCQGFDTGIGDSTETDPLIYCANDSPSYQSPKCDFYTQTQTWVFKDEFATATPA